MSVLRKGRKKMRKKSFLILGLVGCLSVISPVTALAESNLQSKTDLVWTSPTIFKELIREIEDIKKEHPVYTEDDILRIMNERHATTHDEEDAKGIIDIWNALTESEKKLCIRYPFDALKVNTAKNIATNQTEIKFGRNGLGDKSDAFRHGIWNAEMTILIGKEKAELFATAMKIRTLRELNQMVFLKRLIEIWIYIIMRLEEIWAKRIKTRQKMKWQILFIKIFIQKQQSLYGYMNENTSIIDIIK